MFRPVREVYVCGTTCVPRDGSHRGRKKRYLILKMKRFIGFLPRTLESLKARNEVKVLMDFTKSTYGNQLLGPV